MMLEKAGGKRAAPKKRATKNSQKAAEDDAESKARQNAPKKPQTAYFMYSATVREELKKSDPTMKVTQVAKEAGARWRALSTEEKKPWQEKATAAKKEWQTKMDAYLASEEGRWLR